MNKKEYICLQKECADLLGESLINIKQIIKKLKKLNLKAPQKKIMQYYQNDISAEDLIRAIKGENVQINYLDDAATNERTR